MNNPVKFTIAIASAMAVQCLMPNIALADYGAIAYSRSTGRWGASWQHLYSDLARDRALYNCDRRDCVVEALIENTCGALARKRNNTQVVATGFSDRRDRAVNRALAACGSNY
ncbi:MULTISPECIES: DUF4189 domain-containing protein [unclassified Roseofilum]|uniref:DUF4189 domain-containing protein n=1 Tax=unclassified Roseofilum TaxID=2620099 RepID=UPI001B169C05|nr:MULTISPECIES: DUF4189 domain-containing protein [unclassified Roseofilum]MBP0007153.1 DUF4189 domain-containing protein [Roseofilum sp. Belize Diploria]MBP0032085.1 DUF4189 domain-containing protein [Roseofilum sp. Belize BBD 4]